MYYPINHNGGVTFLGSGGGIIFYNESQKLWIMRKYDMKDMAKPPAEATSASNIQSFLKGRGTVVTKWMSTLIMIIKGKFISPSLVKIGLNMTGR